MQLALYKKNNNTKSQAILKNKDLIKSLPYQNYLNTRPVEVPNLKRRPKDKHVLQDIEKIN